MAEMNNAYIFKLGKMELAMIVDGISVQAVADVFFRY